MNDLYSEGLVCQDCSRLFGGYLNEGRVCDDCMEAREDDTTALPPSDRHPWGWPPQNPPTEAELLFGPIYGIEEDDEK